MMGFSIVATAEPEHARPVDVTQQQLEALAKALAEARNPQQTNKVTSLASPPSETASPEDLQALMDALTGVSGQLAGAMAGETMAETDLGVLLETLQRQVAEQHRHTTAPTHAR
jgi:hypothetical protein